MANSDKPPVRVVVGTQWGDEGKGAEVDRMCADSKYDIVIRPAGANNAGHTVKLIDQIFALHQIPSGIIRGKTAVLGSGMAINPLALIDEINELNEAGVDVSRIFISDRASLLMPWHIREDCLREEASSRNKVGTTKRGVGPCYRDDTDRIGLRALGLTDSEDGFRRRVGDKLGEAATRLHALYHPSFDPAEFVDKFPWKELEVARVYLAPLIGDLPEFLRKAREADKGILIECAQGTMLDIRWGTYPFVTSSHPTIAGALDGTGLNIWDITEVIGVVKAYPTRVGLGPFPSQMSPEIERQARELGAEFGTTTGRPRNCGWLDLVQLKYTCRLNGVTGIVLTKLDFLHQLPDLSVCTAYERDGERIDYVPADLNGVKGLLTRVKKWDEPITNCQSRAELPEACQAYLALIEQAAGVPVIGISKGPERSQVIDFTEE